MSLILMLVVFGLIFYFMILRPQQKRTKNIKPDELYRQRAMKC